MNPKTKMRTLTDHKLNGLNEALNINVTYEPGHGGACHRYEVTGFDTEKNASATNAEGYKTSFGRLVIQEALLAIVIDRLRSFQEGQYKCRENAIALTHLEDALMWLQKRTRDRLARGVEGTNAS